MDTKELQVRQRWTLNQKIDHSLYVIESFISHFGGGVYVSFSGGKDSTVLLDLCRRVKPDVMAVFCNTGNEFPDIVQFVRGKVAGGENVRIIRPAMNPRMVIEKYGFPIHSKELARKIYYARKESPWAVNCLNKANSKYALKPKFQYLMKTRYDISDFCCRELKKNPFARFEKETGLHPIIGTMAGESLMRQTQYIRRGGVQHIRKRQNRKHAPRNLDRIGRLAIHPGKRHQDCGHIRQGRQADGMHVLRVRMPSGQREKPIPSDPGHIPEMVLSFYGIPEQRRDVPRGIARHPEGKQYVFA